MPSGAPPSTRRDPTGAGRAVPPGARAPGACPAGRGRRRAAALLRGEPGDLVHSPAAARAPRWTRARYSRAIGRSAAESAAGQRSRISWRTATGSVASCDSSMRHEGDHVVAGDLGALRQEGSAGAERFAREGPAVPLAHAPRELEDHDLERRPLEGRHQLVQRAAQIGGEVPGRPGLRRRLEVRGQEALGEVVVVEGDALTRVQPGEALPFEEVGKPEVAVGADAPAHVRLAGTRGPEDAVGRGGILHASASISGLTRAGNGPYAAQ